MTCKGQFEPIVPNEQRNEQQRCEFSKQSKFSGFKVSNWYLKDLRTYISIQSISNISSKYSRQIIAAHITSESSKLRLTELSHLYIENYRPSVLLVQITLTTYDTKKFHRSIFHIYSRSTTYSATYDTREPIQISFQCFIRLLCFIFSSTMLKLKST